MVKNPNSAVEQEIEKAKASFDAYDQNIKDLTLDRMNQVPVQETEPQTKISQKDLAKTKDIYIKPKRSIGSREKFDEKWREAYNYAKEYVQIIAEHKELIGETLEFWTKAFPGLAAEEWAVPTNKPVWVPRYVANNIKMCRYHRLRSEESTMTGGDSNMKFHGSMVVDTTIQRLDANPVNTNRSIFMGGF